MWRDKSMPLYPHGSELGAGNIWSRPLPFQVLSPEPPWDWLRTRRLQRGVTLAFAIIAIPVAWQIAMRPERQALRYVVSGGASLDSLRTTGGAFLARNRPIQLTFTDGSEIGVRPSARLTVVRLNANGADVRLVDGMVDVDVRQRGFSKRDLMPFGSRAHRLR